MAFCKIMIIGNLGRDPEMRYTPSGRPVTAVQRRRQPQQPDEPAAGEWIDEETDWFRVSVWGDRAERAAENLRKGNRVFVEGRFQTRQCEGKDGQKRTSLDDRPPTTSSASSARGPRRGRRRFAGAPAGRPAPRRAGRCRRGRGGRPPADDTDLDDLPF